MKTVATITLLCVLFPLATLFAADTHWKSIYNADVDGDGIKERFLYALDKKSQNYDGNLTIKSKDGHVLWTHQWKMTPKDLESDLLMNEGNISISHWVRHFFDGTLVYGAKFEKVRIKKDDIDDDYMKFYSKREKIPAAKLKQEILSQKINATLYYRASWREDLVMLVYMPSLKKFIGYSGGEYNN
ncbi:MAG TPA: hypothetical protein DCO77_09110 [Nitrospiraceae bacterium]|nr:hypothetical protein [Nitrospiraceae bacterium]